MRSTSIPRLKPRKDIRTFTFWLTGKKSKALSITIWEDQAAADASEEINLYLEQRVSYPLYSAPPEREGFEVAMKD